MTAAKHANIQCQYYLTCGLIVVDIDALELEIRVAVVGAGRVDTVLVRDHLPELKWKLTMDTCLLWKLWYHFTESFLVHMIIMFQVKV